MIPGQTKIINYILRDIPKPLWDKAKHKIVDEDITLRDLVLKSLEHYLAKSK